MKTLHDIFEYHIKQIAQITVFMFATGWTLFFPDVSKITLQIVAAVGAFMILIGATIYHHDRKEKGGAAFFGIVGACLILSTVITKFL
ncbi:hypothetical protein A2415_04165 [candidate division WWE3 bacterium RIFOXYC1_FULL_39_7]|uniref:Uncharacterized protein n=2 Tax=Katanobacteria TaxID=422282 RepID=A0A1F4X7K3_UNCKA|nr:MAG: hypothetical protein A2415_04165 [candidate division WWE3 bacterium RIFOXYC1_FULL_39_7]OGC77646.1 MAG: hypothetical protein A2619_05415 [candidate division WWE3 bacterium RIFOXYD1_FULL_39_9]